MTSINFAEMLRAERNKAKQQRKVKSTSSLFSNSSKLHSAYFELDEFKVSPLPEHPLLYYIPNFITDQEEEKLINAIYHVDTDPQQQEYNSSRWVCLTNRRLKNLGGVPHQSGMIQIPLPSYVEQVKTLLGDCGLTIPKLLSNVASDVSYNQVLLNEYSFGKGIGDHGDGPLYHPLAAVLSLESPALLHFSVQNEKGERSILYTLLLQPRSLLIFGGYWYTDVKHGIVDATEDTIPDNCLNTNSAKIRIGDQIKRGDKRLSLTIRACQNVKTTEERNYSQHELEEIKRRENWWYNSISEKN